METITSADGTSIAYERSGSGPPLVRVHGTTADHTSWDPVRPAFEDQFTVYVIDRRGRGESGGASDYDVEREFEDVAAVVDSIDEAVTLVGHSFGAICSLEAALRTDNLAELVLYEPPIVVGEHERYSAELHAELAGLVADGEDERALELFLHEVASVPRTTIDELRSTPAWSRNVAAARTIPREYAASTRYEFDPGQFEGFGTPTVLLLGGESPQWIVDAVTIVDETLPDSRVVRLEGQEHVAMVTAPDRYVDAVCSSLGAE